MLLKTTIDIKDIFIISLFLFLLVLSILIIRGWKIRNKNFRKLIFDSIDNNNHKEKLIELIKIKTTSFNDEEGYHQFREKLKELFPIIHEHFIKEKIDGNAIYTYKKHIDNAPNILFATHIDYKYINQDINVDGNEIYGSGTFDAKSLLYVMFEAVEQILSNDKELNVNLTMVMTTDDATTKEGINNIVNQFLKRGRFFDLVLEEGSGIVDPAFFGLRSHYALVGVGVTGESKIRFKTYKHQNGYSDLLRFIDEIKNNNLYKSKLDKYSLMPLREISKDMYFNKRFYFNNISLFKRKAKKIIDNEFEEISKLMKTNIIYGEIRENLDFYYTDVTFQLSTHETLADIVLGLAKYMETYNVEYEIINNKEASKVTSIQSKGYKVTRDAIIKTFQNLFVAPIIITRISEKRYFDKVSDCVIRFSPLYYSYEAFKDAFSGKEHIPLESIDFGIVFYKEILNKFKRR